MASVAEQRVIEFVLWRLRYRDLPDDIREAAEELTSKYPRPFAPMGVTEGPLVICGFPADESTIERRNCFPHQISRIAQDMLEEGSRYVLIQSISENGSV